MISFGEFDQPMPDSYGYCGRIAVVAESETATLKSCRPLHSSCNMGSPHAKYGPRYKDIARFFRMILI